MSLRPLRPRQAQAIADIRDAVRQGHKRIIVQGPCGFGKTLLSAHLIQNALDKGKRPMFVAPAINLITQTVSALEAEGIHLVGVIQGKHERTNLWAPVQVASVQTLVRRNLPEVHFIIQDECHEQYKDFNKLLDADEWKDRIAIGLSATPEYMGPRWTSVVVPGTMNDGFNEGWLCRMTAYGPGVEPELSDLKKVKGEFPEGPTANRMMKAGVTADVVKQYRERGTNGKTFLFAVDCAHAQHLQSLLVEAGFPFGYMDGETSAEDRKEIFRQYRCGEIAGIASVRTLITGVDEDVRCLIDCDPTWSKKRLVQRAGRLARTADGKDRGIYLDHAGNMARLGYPWDITFDVLGSKPTKDSKPNPDAEKPPLLPKKCPQCAMLGKGFPCSNCGFKPDPKERTNTIEHVDGELVEYGSAPKESAKKKKDDPAYKARFYAELLGYAGEMGKSQSWVLAQFRSRFDHWPAKKNSAEPQMAGVEVRNFVKSQQIKYIKGKEKAAQPPRPPSKSVGFEFGYNA